MDILYNNASALRNGALMELSDDDWHFTVRNELDIGGAHGIRANAILPGLIYTPETARFIDDPDGPLPGILAKIPLGQYGRADEVAKLAAFLASDDAAFITGAEIAIDGGDGSVAA